MVITQKAHESNKTCADEILSRQFKICLLQIGWVTAEKILYIKTKAVKFKIGAMQKNMIAIINEIKTPFLIKYAQEIIESTASVKVSPTKGIKSTANFVLLIKKFSMSGAANL